MAQASRSGDGQLVLVATLPSLPARLVGGSEAAGTGGLHFHTHAKTGAPDNPLLSAGCRSTSDYIWKRRSVTPASKWPM
jgi:hypothetical protein